MPHKRNHLLFTFAFWLMALTGFAQTFPVTISTQINQPSPIYWSNYADATTSNSPIKIQIVLNDLTISNRQVRIKCYWQGNGISFMNNDFVVGAQPLFLEGGVPLQLTNVNLAPYFEFQNIIGITPNQYAQAMPEGIYTFSVEVYDVATGQKLSRKSNVTAVIFQNEPPLLNLPLNKASIMQQNIQNIVFSWTPRQINVSNVEYQFDLVEIWDQYTPVQNAFVYSPPIYTTTTRATTLQYGVAEPQLIPGKRYAWRIKAKALVGAEEIGVFKNNGYSEIFAFSYDVYCTPPLQIATDGVSQDQAKVTWSGALDNFDYQVNYREKNADSQWYTAVTPREFVTLTNLKANTTYEYTVGAACEKGKYVHSSLQEFTTLAKDEIAFAGCGIKPDPKDLANQNPLPNLLPNDVVTAGDFPIVVIKSSGSNGRFTGEGYVTLPFLEKFRALIDAADALGGEKVNIGQFSRIRITFDNIGVNTDFKLISGEIIASYDPNWGSMIDGDKLVEDIKDLLSGIKEFLNNYKGTTEDKDKAIAFQKEQNEISTQLLADSSIPQELKTKILEAQNNAKESWENLKNAKPCPDIPQKDKTKKGGPSNDFDYVEDSFECHKTPVEKQAEANEAGLAFLEKIDVEVLKKLAATLQSFGTDIFIKCTICDSNTTKATSTIDNSQKFSIIKQKTKQYLCLIASIKDNKIDNYIPFNPKTDINTEDTKTLLFYDNIKPVFSSKQENILALINAQQQITTCKVVYPFDAKFCENKIITDAITKNITTELQQCYSNELEAITKSLISFKTNSRSNQGIEFAYNGKVYELDGNLKLIEVKDPLSDEDIQNGKWTNTAIDVKIRFTKNSLGVFQYKAFGFRSNLTIAKIKNSEGVFEQKTADLPKLSAYIKEKTNAFFSLNNAFTTPEKTPKQAGIQLNDGETYADGKKLEIDDNSGIFKISSEGIGLVTTLLEEGIVEEKTYLNTPPEGTVIKAPGLVTGSVEVVATKVTDLTTLATGVYDLATDKEARSDAYKGLVKIKESIGNDATTFIPILADVLLSAFSGNTAQDWKSSKDSKTDEGKKSHIFTRGTENTVISAVAGVAFVKELPELAEKVSEKIKKVKNVKKVISNIADLVEEVVSNRKNIRKMLDTDEGVAYARKYYSKYVINRSFEDWWAYAKKYDLNDDLNFEVHHVIPVGVLEKNKDFQEVLLWAEKNGKKFDFNSIDNGIPLQKKKAKIDFNGHANHPQYDDIIKKKVEDVVSNPLLDEEEKFDEIKSLIKRAKTKLESDVLLGNKDVNQILEF